MKRTHVQRLIESALRAKDQQASVWTRVSAPAIPMNQGIEWRDHKDHRLQRMNCFFNTKQIVFCGGCNEGRVPIRDDKGKPTGKTKEHENCHGLGIRINRRYGRVGKGRLK